MNEHGDFLNRLSQNPLSSLSDSDKQEEIHLIITYPIMKSWELLDRVNIVRWKTIQAAKDRLRDYRPGIKIEEE